MTHMKLTAPYSLLVLALTGFLLSCEHPEENRGFVFSSDEKVISLHGLWKFAQGDDIRWSVPGYDDAGWEVVGIPDLWIARGLPGVGRGWYRTWVNVLSTDPDEEAAIVLSGQIGATEVFWDGNLEG